MSLSSIVGTQDTSEIMPRQEFEGHTYWVTGAIHLPCGQRMMTCSLDGSLRVWNLKTGKQIGEDWWDGDWQEEDWRNGEIGVWTIALSPDGEKVVSGSWDGGVRLWDTNKDKVIAKWMGHKKDVISVCRHDHVCNQFATAGYNERASPPESPLKIWDSKTGELIITLKGHTDPVNHLAWTLDGKTLISESDDHSIRTWNTSTWTQIAVLQGHTNIVYAIAISPNNRILASASADNTTRLWNLDNSKPISSPLRRHGTGAVACVSFSADGKLLATGCDDQNTYTWDVHTIIRKAGLDDLLLGRDKKSVHIIASATRRPVQPLKINQVPRGFFDGQPYGAHISARPDAHEALSKPRLFHWVRNFLPARPNGAQIELGDLVVDVPYAKGKRRNASAGEKRKPIPKNSAASSSRPPNSNATHHSSGTAHAQSSSRPQAQATVTTSSTAPAVAVNSGATTSSTNPHAMIKHAGRWTRFWLFICCASPEYTDGHH